MVSFRPELVIALQSQEADTNGLQALQTAQQHSSIQSHEPQVTNLLTTVNQPHDSGLMSGVNQQYLTSGNDDIDESRNDTIIQDGQFSLNAQVNCLLVSIFVFLIFCVIYDIWK